MSDSGNHPYVIKMTRAITAAILETSISAEEKSVIIAQDTVHALIANIAMILAVSPSVSTDRSLREFCAYVAKRLREETLLLRKDPNIKAVGSESLPKTMN